MSEPCQSCTTPADDRCVRCERPTCDDHFFDRDHYGVCRRCVAELDAAGGATHWPYPLRSPLPGAPT